MTAVYARDRRVTLKYQLANASNKVRYELTILSPCGQYTSRKVWHGGYSGLALFKAGNQYAHP